MAQVYLTNIAVVSLFKGWGKKKLSPATSSQPVSLKQIAHTLGIPLKTYLELSNSWHNVSYIPHDVYNKVLESNGSLARTNPDVIMAELFKKAHQAVSVTNLEIIETKKSSDRLRLEGKPAQIMIDLIEGMRIFPEEILPDDLSDNQAILRHRLGMLARINSEENILNEQEWENLIELFKSDDFEKMVLSIMTMNPTIAKFFLFGVLHALEENMFEHITPNKDLIIRCGKIYLAVQNWIKTKEVDHLLEVREEIETNTEIARRIMATKIEKALELSDISFETLLQSFVSLLDRQNAKTAEIFKKIIKEFLEKLKEDAERLIRHLSAALRHLPLEIINELIQDNYKIHAFYILLRQIYRLNTELGNPTFGIYFREAKRNAHRELKKLSEVLKDIALVVQATGEDLQEVIAQATRFAIDISDQRVVLPKVIIEVLKMIKSEDKELETIYNDLFARYFPRKSLDALKETYEPVFLILAFLIREARNRLKENDFDGFQALLAKLNKFVSENELTKGIYLEHILPALEALKGTDVHDSILELFPPEMQVIGKIQEQSNQILLIAEAIKTAGLWEHFIYLAETKELKEMENYLAYIPAFLAKTPEKIAELLKKDTKESIFTSLKIVEAIDESGIYDLLKEAFKKVEFEKLAPEIQLLGIILEHSNQVSLIVKAMKKADTWKMFVKGLSEFGDIKHIGDQIKTVLAHLRDQRKAFTLETLSEAFKYQNIFDAIEAI